MARFFHYGRLIGSLLLCAVFGLARPVWAQPDDPVSRMLLAYPLTSAKIEATTAAYEELAATIDQDPASAAKLRAKTGMTSPEQAEAQLDAIPAVRQVMQKHGINSHDFLWLPVALGSTLTVVTLSQRGMTVPANRTNPANVQLVSSDVQRFEALARRLGQARVGLSGRP